LHSNSIKAVTAFARLAYKVMSRNGDAAKKIWISEIGCPGVKSGLGVKNWWMEDNPNEQQQGQWLRSVYCELLKDEHVEKIFWAFFRDAKNHWNNGVDYFGIIRYNFSRKPAFKAYRQSFENWKKSQNLK
jgi:exo-beta-1,3-glucanase (GH17 family)